MCTQVKRDGARVMRCTRHKSTTEGNRVTTVHYSERWNGAGEIIVGVSHSETQG